MKERKKKREKKRRKNRTLSQDWQPDEENWRLQWTSTNTVCGFAQDI